MGMRKKHVLVEILKYAVYLAGIVLVMSCFTNISISFEKGIVVTSDFIFKGAAKTFFPWTWYELYLVAYRVILPAISFLFLAVMQENHGSQLEQYQTAVMFEGFILMWIINAAIAFISKANPAFTLLYGYAYLFMYVIIYISFTKNTVPSGKAQGVSFVKSVISYILPAAILAFVAAYLQPMRNNFVYPYIIIYIAASVLCVLFSLWVSSALSSSRKLYTADYEAVLERDLASIEYQDVEMDEVTTRMYEIFRKNVEASSVNVYILTGQNDLEIAYSSNNTQGKISLSNPVFDNLLNVGRSIVVRTQLEKDHVISDMQVELNKFFNETKSDALFILNEGHNIFGMITLGKKVSGDHYKDYDYNVFVKLYSYFFVFGYYMRNIANKDIMGIVNREIRMSSQIITSIQENLDHVKNPKVDVGYKMVPAHNIGGEFIDMIRLTDSRHLFVVGDLSGKGIAASMNMVILKSIIRTYLAEIHDFKQLVVKLNEFIRNSFPKGTIFAGLFALVDFNTDTMYYINCGVPALMMYTQVYNNVIEIQGSGYILGFVKDISPYISVKTTKLSYGDIILACTDGLIQSHSLRGEQFGKERVQQAILDNSTYPAQRMAQFTFDNLMKFMSKEMEDDVSILVLKYEGNMKEESETSAVTEKHEVTENDGGTEDVQEVAEAENEKVEEPDAVAPDFEGGAEEVKSAEISSDDGLNSETSEAENSTDLPQDFDMPDLSNLDSMMKEAGL